MPGCSSESYWSYVSASRARPVILFVDNERAIRQYCQQELELDGYQVHLADDGEEAVSLIANLSVDLVILDRHMRFCGGLEAAGHIKRAWPHLPVILYTADGDYADYRAANIDACVLKTEDLRQLKAVISQLLARSGSIRRQASSPSTVARPCF